MATTKGMQESRVNKPKITNVAQNTSANNTMASDVVEPTPKGSAKCAARDEKCINLSRPCCISISDPMPTRVSNMANEKALSDTPVLKSFLTADILTGKFTATISFFTLQILAGKKMLNRKCHSTFIADSGQ